MQDQEPIEVYHANDVEIQYTWMLVSSYTTLCMHKCLIHLSSTEFYTVRIYRVANYSQWQSDTQHFLLALIHLKP